MNFNNCVGNVLSNENQYTNKSQNVMASQTRFKENLQGAMEAGAARVDEYTEYLKAKYGNVTIQSIGKDQASLDRVGKSMSGNDVIIAPNILDQMANDSDKAAYYEGKIEDFFNSIPQLKASFSAKGLEYQPCGVVIHEDGGVTYISGCADSSERVAEVNAINEAEKEKEEKQRKEGLEHSQEAKEQQRKLIEQYNQKQMINFYFVNLTQVTSSAAAAYETAIGTQINRLINT